MRTAFLDKPRRKAYSSQLIAKSARALSQRSSITSGAGDPIKSGANHRTMKGFFSTLARQLTSPAPRRNRYDIRSSQAPAALTFPHTC